VGWVACVENRGNLLKGEKGVGGENHGEGGVWGRGGNPGGGEGGDIAGGGKWGGGCLGCWKGRGQKRKTGDLEMGGKVVANRKRKKGKEGPQGRIQKTGKTGKTRLNEKFQQKKK